MSTTTTKFCVDCKWHGYGPAHLDMCHHPEHGWLYEPRVSLVDGKMIHGSRYMCGDARNKYHPCGPEAKIFEQKVERTFMERLKDWIHER